MRLLNEADRKLFLGPFGKPGEFVCDTCKEQWRRNYCRQCDEFFFQCACPGGPTERTLIVEKEQHVGHRTY